MQFIPWIIVASWAIFILYWIVSSFTVKRDVGRKNWQALWWLRIAVIFVTIGWIWGSSPLEKEYLRSHAYATTSTGALAVIGVVLCVLGIALAVWARVYLGRDWSPVPSLKEGHELVTSGPYALIRHPIYTGIIFAALGSALESPIWLILFVAITGMFLWRVHAEEQLMLEQFPNVYPEYKKRTWALIPYVW